MKLHNVSPTLSPSVFFKLNSHCPYLSLPPSLSLSLLGISLSKLSASSSHPLPSIQQRHIVTHTVLEKNLEKGRFCDTYIGLWRRDKVLVKVFSENAERVWFTESTIHQVLTNSICIHTHVLQWVIWTCMYSTYLLF